MKRFKLFALMPLLALVHMSCSKDNDGNGGGGGGYQWPKYDKLVKTVTWQSDYGDTDECTFTYDNQHRITKVAWEEQGYFLLYSYDNNKILVNEDNEYYTTYILDNNGYLTRQDDDDGSYMLHQYSNGYASKSTEENNDDVDYECILTWISGNLVKTTDKYTNAYGTYNYGCSWTYSKVANKLNINIFDIFDSFWWNPIYINFKGRVSKNYPLTLTETDGETITFTYTLDNDGYPTKIVDSSSEGGWSSSYTISYY